ncbi:MULTISPECIES: PAS domain-containing sensor histidine kinase [Polaromonas]|uniref:histidine kinase n=1 Tax=Polaromonas aquatica TaxID=332657 RepID=A0ABW1U1T7_9BURK
MPSLKFGHASLAASTRRSLALLLAFASVLTTAAALDVASNWYVAFSLPALVVMAALTTVLAFIHAGREAVQRRASDVALDGADARMAGLIDSAMDAIVTVNEAQDILLYNQAAEKIFGWTPTEVLNRPLTRLIPRRFHAEHAVKVTRFGSTGVTSRRMGDGMVLYGVRKNGQEFPLEASISHLATPQGKLFTVILRDVTERVRASEELSAFATAVHAVRESEKTRIARELHDELAQSLTALKMDAIWVREMLPADADAPRDKLEDMLALLDTTVAATRRIASDLRPLLLDDLGLVPAIEWLANNFTQRSGIVCHLSLDDEVELGEPYATAVFRIVQEALVNVSKHAEASRVELKIEKSATGVALLVEDNGKGFALDAPRKAASLGLMGLRERARLLRGTIDVDTALGKGTCIRVVIPLPELESAE